MYAEQREDDVACISGWYGLFPSQDGKPLYNGFVLPKLPLLLACLTEDQEKANKSTLKTDNWRKVGWYPGCHYDLNSSDGYPVWLYCKEQDVPPVDVKRTKRDGYIQPAHFNSYISMGCSIMSMAKRSKLTPRIDEHCVIGLHRMTKKTTRVTFNNWHKFATTSLASYWFWGLLPNETDVHKFE